MATVDTKVITAQNQRTQKMLTSGLVIVDAAMEPLRVLKVLMEGLGPDVKAGLWLTNFRGVPVARTLSPFDLIYLDIEYRVVHCIEISTEGQYAPFRGEPASALVLPPKAIVASNTRPGDRLQFRAVDESAAPPPTRATENRGAPRAAASPAAAPQTDAGAPQPAHFFNSAFPVPPPQQAGTPLDRFLSARTAKSRDDAADAPAANQVAQEPPAPPAPSGRLTKTTRSVLELAPALRPVDGAESASPFYAGSVAHAVEPIAYAAPAEQRAALAASASLALPAEAHPPVAMASGRLRRIPHLAPEIVPPIEPPQPVAEPTPTAAAQAASPLPVPQPPREPAAKPANAVVIPIKQSPAQPPPNTSASPERAPALPAQAPIAPPAAAVPSPIPMLPPAEASPSFALAPVAKASPAPRPAAPAPQVAAPTPVPAPIPLITQPSVRRPSAPPPAMVETHALTSTAQPSTPQPSIPPPANNLLAPAANDQPIYPRVANPGIANPGVANSGTANLDTANQGNTSLAPTGPKAIEPARKTTPSWDVKLLYALFPEFDPSRPPEIRIPRIQDKLLAEIDDEDERPSRKLQILCWLYPHLKLDQVKQRRAEERRAPRLPMPGLVAYFFTGGSPRPHPIKDISVTGFYMQTEERWLPGTVIRVTLQMVNAHGEDGRDSVTVLSRVVRWGPDGGGFEFVLPGFMET